MKSETTSTTLKRFQVASTIDGYEVIDRDGRSVTDSYEFANRPMKIAASLNDCGDDVNALRIALGCITDADELDDFDTLEVLNV